MASGAALLALLAGAASIDIQSPGPELLTINVNAAPLADVLERVSQRIGMRVVYETPPPRQLISLRLEARTPVAAVLGILEGLGLSYAVVMDPTGARVETLLFPTSSPAGVRTAGAAPPPAPAPGRPAARPATPPGRGRPPARWAGRRWRRSRWPSR